MGFIVRNNRAEMIDFGALISNVYGWLKFFHTVSSGYLVAAFFVMGISAWHLIRKNEIEFFNRSFRTSAFFSLFGLALMLTSGAWSAELVAQYQPAKLAAMESQWENVTGASYNLWVIPDPSRERNSVETMGGPKLLSLLAYHDASAEVKGLKSFPKENRPPVWPVFIGYRFMLAFGMAMALLSLISVFIASKGTAEKYGLVLRLLVFAIPLPYLAAQAGWIVAEVGRQPWIVYNVLRTSDAASRSISSAQVIGSLVGFTLLYGFLGFVDIFLLTSNARKGPQSLNPATPSLKEA